MNRKILFTFCGSLLFAALCGCMAQTNEPVETVTIDPDIEMIDIDTETDGFTYYDLDVQEEIQSQIDAFKSETHTMEDPLLIFDPYGTNTTSLYIWFEEEEASVLSYTIQCEGYENFSRTLYSDSEDNISTAHEHQLIGLVPGETNTITLSAANSNGTLLEQVEFTVEAPQLSSGYPTQIEKSTENDAELTDGLYMTFGLNYSYDGYSFLIDNDGTVRGELPLDGDMIENVMFYNDTMFYSVNLSKAVRVDRLGKVIAVYEFPEYELHHDYALNDDGEIIALATEYAKESVEDIIISIDLESGDIDKIIDFDEVMGDYKALTQPYSADSLWGSQDWDWLHFNSIQLVNEDEMILSSRETSTIMKFDIFMMTSRSIISSVRKMYGQIPLIPSICSQKMAISPIRPDSTMSSMKRMTAWKKGYIICISIITTSGAMKAGSNRSAAQKVIPHHFRTMAIPSLITPAISSMRMNALINWSIPYRFLIPASYPAYNGMEMS